jgi:hypothetical protein
LQSGNGEKFPPVFVTTRAMEQQIFDGGGPKFLQLPRPFGPDTPKRRSRRSQG